MKSATFAALAAIVTLTGCFTPEPPRQVGMFQGKPAYQIYTSMQVYDDLNPAELEAVSKILETQNEHGALPYRASQQCPQGYKVVDRSIPESKFAMVLANGLQTWRVSQVFSIVCEG